MAIPKVSEESFASNKPFILHSYLISNVNIDRYKSKDMIIFHIVFVVFALYCQINIYLISSTPNRWLLYDVWSFFKKQRCFYSFRNVIFLFSASTSSCIRLSSLLKVIFFLTVFLAGCHQDYQQVDLFWQKALEIVITSFISWHHQDCMSEGEKCSSSEFKRRTEYRTWSSSVSCFILCHSSVFVNCAGRNCPQRELHTVNQSRGHTFQLPKDKCDFMEFCGLSEPDGQ